MKSEALLPRVAVLLATYNGASHCEAQLASILWQCGVHVHVYIRDDVSLDETPAIIKEWAARHEDRITIIDNKGVRTGAASGNFFALLEAVDMRRHDYVALSDQDDIWAPKKLARAINQMNVCGAVGYSSDLIVYDTFENKSWVLKKGGAPVDFDYLFQGASAGCTYVLTAEAASIAAKVILLIPTFCRNASHDWILYAICRSRGMNWVHDEGSEILYRQHATNQYGAKRGLLEMFAKLRDVRSSWYQEHILWMKNVLVRTDAEMRVLNAIGRGRLSDRCWLINNAGRFRRTHRSVALLRIAFALCFI